MSLLGPPVIEVGAAPVETDTRKAVALLAYLAVTGRPSRRDALAALLWPDADREHAGAALRRTLSVLRKAVGPERIAVEHATVALAPDAADVDVARVAGLIAGTRAHGHAADAVCERCCGPLAEAAVHHRGPFLEGFALRDSAAFDDWQFFTGEELRRSLAGILERLAAAQLLVGDLDGAIGAARRWLALDPLHEPAHRELMRLYAWHGQHAAALRQYRECVRVLDRELGVEPLEETTAVYRDIVARRGDPPRAAPPPPPPAPAPASAPAARPFVGRDAELDAVVAAVTAPGDNGVLVVVEGEAGIGKSRLVAEALADPRLARRPNVTARCYEGETGLAYGLVADALRAVLQHAEAPAPDDHVLVEVARLLPEVAAGRSLPEAPPLDGPGAASRFADGLGRFLAAGLAGGVLVCEDLHWADEASLDVLTHLVRRLEGRPIAVVVTWRSERVPRGHRLRRMLAEARRDGRGVAIVLGRLDAAAVTEIVAAAAPAARDLAPRVSAETEGLPLLVTEYVAALARDEQALDRPLPGDTRDVLLSRLDGVSAPAAQVLATAAVLGRSFDRATVRDASGRSDEETAAALEELVEQGLIVEAGEAFDFTHAALRTLAYEEAGLARRRLLHRRAAQALSARGRRLRQEGPLAGAIAGHLRLAGDDEQAAAWAARAGDHAAGLLALAEAKAQYEQALALGHPDQARMSEALGDVATRTGSYGQARARYQAAAAQAPTERVAVLEHKLGGVYARQGDWLLADRHYEDALGALAGDAGLAARILADRSLAAHRRGHPQAAEALSREAMAAARTADDPAALAQAHNLLGILATSRGELARAREELSCSLELARGLADPGAELAAANNLALALAADGDVERALEVARAAVERSAVWGDRHREAALHNNLADLMRRAGRDEEAMAHLKQAVALFAEVGEPGVLDPEIWKLTEW